MAGLPYSGCAMKMTMSIDEALLKRVMKLTGFTTKTEAVNFALKEAERVDPNYDLMALRIAELPAATTKKSDSR
ncbi:MAG: type II toxin-antitoxin system VapB family antitoxin [Chthoniobacterales bacterium]|nr:type II toxin-antitoxin system VapB family antitoxin [Chthoniobacterales bacterium]